MSSEKIGSFIQKCRKEKNLTQEELGEILGVSSKSVSRWENSVTMPDLSLITTIAKELGVEVSELLNGQRMNNDELLELRGSIDKVIKYANYEEKTKNRKANILIIIQMVILLIAVINTLVIFHNVVIQQIINICLHCIGIGIASLRIYENTKEYEFKSNNMVISDTETKQKKED